MTHYKFYINVHINLYLFNEASEISVNKMVKFMEI